MAGLDIDNVRELLGALNRLIAHQAVSDAPLDAGAGAGAARRYGDGGGGAADGIRGPDRARAQRARAEAFGRRPLSRRPRETSSPTSCPRSPPPSRSRWTRGGPRSAPRSCAGRARGIEPAGSRRCSTRTSSRSGPGGARLRARTSSGCGRWRRRPRSWPRSWPARPRSATRRIWPPPRRSCCGPGTVRCLRPRRRRSGSWPISSKAPEPGRPPGGARRGGGAGRRYNPLVLVGGSGIGEDPPAPRGRQRCSSSGASARWLASARAEFTAELIDAIDRDTVAPGGTLPPLRRAAARRRAPHRREGPHPGGALPAVQPPRRVGPPAHLHLGDGAAAITGLEPRLRTRLEGGLVVDLPAPDPEVRERVVARELRRESAASTPSSPPISPPGRPTRCGRAGAAAAGAQCRGGARAGRRPPRSRARCSRASPRRRRRSRAAGSVERHRRRPRRRRPEPGEDGVGVARDRRPPDRGVALMAIKGSLKEASLPDVIQLLFLGRRTGCLALADRHNFGTIYFDEGHIIFAAIVNRRDRLGDILVESGRITPSSSPPRSTRSGATATSKLGEILVEQRRDRARGAGAATSGIQIEEAVYYLFTWTPGHLQLRGRRPPGAGGLPGPDQPGVPAARGRPAGGRVEPDREEDPDRSTSSSRSIRRTSAQSAPELSAEQRRLLPLLDGTPRRPAGRRRLGPGRVRGGEGAVRPDHGRVRPSGRHLGRGRAQGQRRPGRRAPQPRRRLLQGRDARRGAAGVPPGGRSPAGATPARRSISGSSRCARRAGTRRPTRFTQAVERGAARGRRRCTTSACALERLGRLDEAEAAYGDAAGAGPRRRRASCSAGASSRSSAGEHPVAQGRLARALELLGGEAGAGALVLGGHARRRRARRRRRRARGGPGRRRGAIPASAGASEQPRRAARAGAATWPAPRPRCARRWPRTRRCRRSPRTWPTSSTATAATTRRARPTSAPPSSRPIWATTSTSSWATSPTSGATAARRGRAGAGPRRSTRATSWPGPTSTCWTGLVSRPTTRRSPRWRGRSPSGARLRARGLQGQVHPPADRGPHARVRRAHLRRLPRAARPRRRRVRAPARRAHHQRHPVLPERRDLGRCSAATLAARRCARARRRDVRVWSAGCSSGEEPYTLAMLVAEHARRERPPADALEPARDRRDRHRPRQPRARARRRAIGAEALTETARRAAPGATSSRWATTCRWSSGSRRLVRVRAARPEPERRRAGHYHLILCRNVVIYFDRAMQERLFQAFADALAPGRLLVLGKVETLLGPARERLHAASTRASAIYRRPA